MKKVLKRGKVKQTLAAMVFCMALGAGTVCSADEGKVTVESAKIRAAADASSEQVGSVKQGGTVDIIQQSIDASIPHCLSPRFLPSKRHAVSA